MTERTYDQAEVDAILKAAFPGATPQDREARLRMILEPPTLVERLRVWPARHSGGPDTLDAKTVGDLMLEAAAAIPVWRTINEIGGENTYRNGEPVLIRRPDAAHQTEDGWHVARWSTEFLTDGGWVIHDGKNDHPLRGDKPTLWMPLPA